MNRTPPSAAQLEAAERVSSSLAALVSAPATERERAVRRAGVALRRIVAVSLAEGTPLDVLEELADRCEELAAPLGAAGRSRTRVALHVEGPDGEPLRLELSPNITQSNPVVPDIDWRVDAATATVTGTVTYGVAHQGPPGCVHGGFVAAAFDEALGLAEVLSGQLAMTGRLTVRYRRPTPLHEPLTIEAWLDATEGRKVSLSARIRRSDGELTAEAEGLFVTVSRGHFAVSPAAGGPGPLGSGY